MEREDGRALAKRGVDLMNSKHYTEAYPFLFRGIELLLDELNRMPDSKAKKSFSTSVSGLLTKAEECKRLMTGGPSARQVSALVRTNTVTIARKAGIAPVRKSQAVTGNAAPEDPLESMIEQEIIMRTPGVRWEDIAGLEQAKQALKEAIILPAQYPEVFTGLRAPPKGILLFGPPGTGKTLLAKAVASESNATFFNFGEAEKLVRVLFTLARRKQPSVVFIDEMDSILGARSSGQHEASRRLETEFLAQVDGFGNSSEDRVVLIGATNRPQELDEAVLRRMPKRIYIELPGAETREQLISHLLQNQPHNVTPKQLKLIVKNSQGYSGSDLAALCKEAAMVPIRSIKQAALEARDIPPITLDHFKQATNTIRPSVSKASLDFYLNWNREFGSN